MNERTNVCISVCVFTNSAPTLVYRERELSVYIGAFDGSIRERERKYRTFWIIVNNLWRVIVLDFHIDLCF